MVGDLKNGRTARSLSYLLGKFNGVTIFYVSPPDTRMSEDVKEYLQRHKVKFIEMKDLRLAAREADVIYQTRTQSECGAHINRNDRSAGYYVVNAEILSFMKAKAIVMHPLPRVDEITIEVDSDPRAVYLTEQIDSGLFTRMALLKMILVPEA